MLSVNVNDTVASIQHKINVAGSQHTHSAAMTKEYMDCMLTWAASKYLLNHAFNYLQFVMTGLGSPPAESTPGKKVWSSMTRDIEHLTFCAVAFMLWTRYVHNSCSVSSVIDSMGL